GNVLGLGGGTSGQEKDEEGRNQAEGHARTLIAPRCFRFPGGLQAASAISLARNGARLTKDVDRPEPDAIAAALARHGLILRGGFNFAPDEAAPPGPSGSPARSVLLVGQAGDAPWPHFLRWREKQPAAL